jgi:hypothetical protein
MQRRRTCGGPGAAFVHPERSQVLADRVLSTAKGSPRGRCELAVLDRSGRHVHRHRGAAAGWAPGDAQIAVGNPAQYRDAAVAGIRALLGLFMTSPFPPRRPSRCVHYFWGTSGCVVSVVCGGVVVPSIA